MRYSIIFLAVGAAYAAPLAFNPLDVVVSAPDAVLAGGKVVSSEVHAIADGGSLKPVPVNVAATAVDAVLSPVKVVDHTLHTLTGSGGHPQGHPQEHPAKHPQHHDQPHHEDHPAEHPQHHDQPHHEDHPAGHPAGHPSSHPQDHSKDHPYKSGSSEPTVVGVLTAGTDAVLASGGVVSHSAHHNVAADDNKKQESHVNPLSAVAKVPDATLAPVKVVNSDLHKSAARTYPADHDIISLDLHPHVAANPKVGPVHVGEAVGVHEKVHVGIPAGSTHGHAGNNDGHAGSIDGHAISHVVHVVANTVGHVEPDLGHIVHTVGNKIASPPLHL